jgi:hypothetical protein
MAFLGFGRTKITSMKVLSLTFTSDHHLMTSNNSGWTDSGSINKPDWTYGKQSFAISHTKNLPVSVQVDFEVNPGNADATDATVTGTAAFGSLVFTTKQSFKGGTVTIKATSSTPLPDLVQKLTGNITWSVDTKEDGTFAAGDSWGHTVYVTMGTPENVGGLETGITQFRMDKSVALVQATGAAQAPWDSAPDAIVLSLMKTLGMYTVVPSQDAALVALDHPQYGNSVEGPMVPGGAWNFADHIPAQAECQAIVRFVRGVIKQIGCPGTAQIMTVYVDPTVNNGNTALEDDYEHPPKGNCGLHHVASQTINNQTCLCLLLDTDPGSVGKVWDGNERGRMPGLEANFYEACMRFTSPAGTVRYYPGGTAGGFYPTKEAVIAVPMFAALVWMSQPAGGKTGEWLLKVEKVVKRW